MQGLVYAVSSFVSTSVSLSLLPHDFLAGVFIPSYLHFLVKRPAHALCVAGLYPRLGFSFG